MMFDFSSIKESPSKKPRPMGLSGGPMIPQIPTNSGTHSQRYNSFKVNKASLSNAISLTNTRMSNQLISEINRQSKQFSDIKLNKKKTSYLPHNPKNIQKIR
jgi:hypothetical protein